MAKTTRLIKIASDINIGKDAIVDFLNSRGFNVENKSTTMLTEEMISLIHSNFQKEMMSMEKQRKRLKEIKETNASSLSKVSPSPKDDEPVPSRPKKASIAKVEGVQPAKPAVPKPEVLEKTLSEESPKPKPIQAKPPKSDIFPSAPPKAKPIEPKVVPVAEQPVSKVSVASAKDMGKDSLKDNKLPEVGAVIQLEPRPMSRSKADSKKERAQKRETEKKSIKDKEDSLSTVKAKKSNKNDADQTSKTASKKKDFSATEDTASDIAKKKKNRKKKKPSDSHTEPAVQSAPKEEPKPVPPVEVPKVVEEEKPKIISNNEHNLVGVNNKIRTASNSFTEFKILDKIEIIKEERVFHAPRSHKTQFSTGRTLRSRGEKDNIKDKQLNKRSKDRDEGENKRFDKEDNRNGYRYNKDNKENKENRYYNRDNKERTYPGDPTNRYKDPKQIGGQSQYRRPERREVLRFESDKSTENKAPARPKYTSAYVTKTPEKKVFSNNTAPRSDRAPERSGFFDDKRKKRKMAPAETYSDVDVNKVIRATLVGMEDTSASNKKAKIKLKKKAVREEKEARQQAILERESKVLKLTEFVTTSDLAALLNIKPNEIITKCFGLGLMVSINQRLDKDTILLIVDDYGLEVEFSEETTLDIIDELPDEEGTLSQRPPIVTIMGHVDHGKTSLLDYIRRENVVAGEAGGITQHIGAYRVILENGKSITFLDTPGHEAFTAMRARGAQVTDIVVIVVAADDSVMPQTIEAISHARAANVPIVIAINKIDRAEANVDKIKQQLSEQGILVEDWGGKYQCTEISAKKGTNIDILLDKILLEAEMLELQANASRKAQGVVIESKMTKGWGNVATIVVQKGTLFLQDNFVAGANYGKVRALLDERSNKVSDVLPSQPVVVVGFDSLPNAGDSFVVVSSEVEAREIATKRQQLRREQAMRKVRFRTLDDISAQISLGEVKDLNLIIKGDVAGSVEALGDSLFKLSTEEVRVNIIMKSVGIITESDVMLAAASNAIIIGFNISSTPQAAKLADSETVEIRRYNIIYDCLNEIHLALEGMLKPDIKEEIAATIEVRQIFKISRIGQIAGSYVISGKVSRNDKVRIIRDGFPIFNGSISSLKRNKDDAKEVDAGYECGLQVGNFNTFVEGDIIEALRYVEVKRTLEIKQ